MPVVGPGSVQSIATDVRPLLESASEYEYVTILNPLSDDFAIRVAQDVPVNMPVEIRNGTALVQSERDLNTAYGLGLKNPDFKQRKSIYNDTIIRAGGTINLKGNEAQVAVRQIVNEMMQRGGDTRLMSDPTLRNTYENQVIVSRGSIQDLMESNLQTPRAQLDAAITKSNEVTDARPFPGLEQATQTTPEPGTDSGSQSNGQERRSPGRPKKT